MATRTSLVGGAYTGACACGAPAPDVVAYGTRRIVRDPAVPFVTRGGVVVRRDVADLRTAGMPPGTAVSLTLRSAIAAPFATLVALPGGPVLAPIEVGFWLDPRTSLVLAAGVVQGARVDTAVVPPSFTRGLLVGARLDLSMPAVGLGR